jgi:hypothetical protein
MASAWAERQPMADIWIDVRRGGSLSFRLLCGVQKLYRHNRAAAKRIYLSLKRRAASPERQ